MVTIVKVKGKGSEGKGYSAEVTRAGGRKDMIMIIWNIAR